MLYAILRTAKLTHFGNIAASASHNFRERDTPNADSERTPLNQTEGAQSSKEVMKAVKERLATQSKVRKNAVLALEYFIGASPEWFGRVDEKQREAYFDAAQKWLLERHGTENVVAVTRQYDETSPHMCAYVVPIDPKGKLNCSHFLDGRVKLSQMQTEFAEKVGRSFGLERGIEGSKAKHKTIQQYYAEIQAPVKMDFRIEPEALKPRTFPPQTFLEKVGLFKQVESSHEVAERLTNEARDAYWPAVQAGRQCRMEKAAHGARTFELAELKARATLAREMPLERVLERLECLPEPKDRKNWRTPIGRMTVEGSKFFAHDVGKGGGGAIDLVMLVDGTDYRGAVQWLVGEFSKGEVLADAVAKVKREVEAAVNAPRRPYKAPEEAPERWPRVRDYLTQKRGLSSSVVDKLHEEGRIYADNYANAVFVLHRGHGVELRGTGDKSFHGIRGEKAPFTMASRGEKKVAFVESAIDAISLSDLGFQGEVLSTSGFSSKIARKMADGYRDHGWKVVAAFDNDKAGEQMAENLGYPRDRIRPQNGKDWNDELRLKKSKATKKMEVERKTMPQIDNNQEMDL